MQSCTLRSLYTCTPANFQVASVPVQNMGRLGEYGNTGRRDAPSDFSINRLVPKNSSRVLAAAVETISWRRRKRGVPLVNLYFAGHVCRHHWDGET